MRAASHTANPFQGEPTAILNSHVHDCRQLLHAKRQYRLGKSDSGKHALSSPSESTAKRSKYPSSYYDYPDPAAHSTMEVYRGSTTSVNTQPTYFEVDCADAGDMSLYSRYTGDLYNPFLDVSGTVPNQCVTSILVGSGYLTNSEISATFGLSAPYIQPENVTLSDTEFVANSSMIPQLHRSTTPTVISGSVDKIHPADFFAIRKIKGTSCCYGMHGIFLTKDRVSPNRITLSPKQRS